MGLYPAPVLDAMLRALKLLERRFGGIEDLFDGSQVVNVLAMSGSGGRVAVIGASLVS